ncbi:MAG: imidazole glycerol phosphate synthase subunit HisH 1 [Patescibacteria group bacterium]|nr:MAG: imidazole glycerol phosphate synthase subunit HisH 1 [Patescibacteria group bacterium]
MKKICILDYGSGNVRSVFNIVSLIEKQVVISNEPKDIIDATHLILPGVGAFGSSMKKIQKNIPLELLKTAVFNQKKPFLGICVGMQVLADTGHEFGIHKGLGWIPGVVKVLSVDSLPLPHVGWNNIEVVKESVLTKHLPQNSDFYFVHSFCFEPKNEEVVVAHTNYGTDFCSILQKDNIYGVQFHPEKSQQTGKILLENFLRI